MRRKKLMKFYQPSARPSTGSRAGQEGFTLIETTVAMVVMMIVGLGAASLFFFAINYNTGANDRQLAMGVAQQQMEWMREIRFDSDTRNVALTAGGLKATDANGIKKTVTNGGRSYTVVTHITDIATDADGQPTLKRVTVQVSPQASSAALGAVTLTTLRATTVKGPNT
jgi:Tfp pilus assembly protein PilV